MAAEQGNPSSEMPDTSAARFDQLPPGRRQDIIERQNEAEKRRFDPAARPGAMVSQVLQPQYMKLANPGPLGLLSFALTTFVLGLYECGAG